MQTARGIFAVLLLGTSGCVADAALLRGPHAGLTAPPQALVVTAPGAEAALAKASAPPTNAQAKLPDLTHEVVNKTSITKNKSASDACLCPLGEFWHWRIKSCVKQGGFGYECGWFPAEHHDEVCADGLKCVEAEGAHDTYHLHPGAVPASCKPCTPADNCLTGEERHNKNCNQEYNVSGSACQTVRVKFPKTKMAKAGVAEGSACVTVDEVKDMLGLDEGKRIGAKLSSAVVSRGDEEAFKRAEAKAKAAAESLFESLAAKFRKDNANDSQKKALGKDAARAKQDAAGANNAADAAEREARDAEEKASGKAEGASKAKATKAETGNDGAQTGAAQNGETGADGAATETGADATETNADAAADAAGNDGATDPLSDLLNRPRRPEAGSGRPTETTTNAPRKLSPGDIDAKLP